MYTREIFRNRVNSRTLVALSSNSFCRFCVVGDSNNDASRGTIQRSSRRAVVPNFPFSPADSRRSLFSARESERITDDPLGDPRRRGEPLGRLPPSSLRVSLRGLRLLRGRARAPPGAEEEEMEEEEEGFSPVFF